MHKHSHTHKAPHAHTVFPLVYTKTAGERERERRSTLLSSRMQKKFMLPLSKKRWGGGASCVSSDKQLSLFSTHTHTHKVGPVILGTCLPPKFLLAGRSRAMLVLAGLTLCYSYKHYFCLLFLSRAPQLIFSIYIKVQMSFSVLGCLGRLFVASGVVS